MKKIIRFVPAFIASLIIYIVLIIVLKDIIMFYYDDTNNMYWILYFLGVLCCYTISRFYFNYFKN